MEQKRFKCKDEVIYSYSVFDIDRSKNISIRYAYGVFSHYEEYQGKESAVINGFHYNLDETEILPYEGNQHLVGTLPIEYFTLEKGEPLVVEDYLDILAEGFGKIMNFDSIEETEANPILASNNNSCYGWKYCIPFNKFKLNNAEENRKNILMVSNGKLVKAIREE